ncbi:flagellar biosynthesis anti-sigma factor FlgM [Alteribacter keqinensis]|uniref:Negative regulator of flagellin synthesis n=1 Tax=Alteribacter keqinensis TaxID=2483800 RepID=A0A3M7TRB3_9BACI|nr:flagellar biosynthesis anti-sigma factor FlgM [Alteribacter keqinensis]RNA67570.1 flagellar biosynthesis anti-sigma factor FlgM [Alteribacter keqinensis]
MKINPMQSLNMYRQQQGGPNNGKSPVNNRKDEVQISSEAKKMQEGTAAAKVRAEKVQEIKERVENGTYEVNVKETARRMYDFWTD